MSVRNATRKALRHLRGLWDTTVRSRDSTQESLTSSETEDTPQYRSVGDSPYQFHGATISFPSPTRGTVMGDVHFGTTHNFNASGWYSTTSTESIGENYWEHVYTNGVDVWVNGVPQYRYDPLSTRDENNAAHWINVMKTERLLGETNGS